MRHSIGRERKGGIEGEGTQFSTWAPEKFSIMSWNLDGLDDKNLEKRMDHVVQLVEK
jgi:hypothetical protein